MTLVIFRPVFLNLSLLLSILAARRIESHLTGGERWSAGLASRPADLASISAGQASRSAGLTSRYHGCLTKHAPNVRWFGIKLYPRYLGYSACF